MKKVNDKNDEEYISLIEIYNSSNDLKELISVMERFKELKDYRDSENYVDRCSQII